MAASWTGTGGRAQLSHLRPGWPGSTQRRQSRPLLAAPEGSLDGRFLATQADAPAGLTGWEPRSLKRAAQTWSCPQAVSVNPSVGSALRWFLTRLPRGARRTLSERPSGELSVVHLASQRCCAFPLLSFRPRPPRRVSKSLRV